jgi:hypothetical protein
LIGAYALYAVGKIFSTFHSGEFFDDYLLTLIEEGQVSLLRAPPRSLEKDTLADDWTLSQLKLTSLQTRALLELCMRDFTRLYASVKEPGWASAIEAEIAEDVLSMQLQPAMMDTYRRYVVIKGNKDTHIPWDKDAVRACNHGLGRC